MATALSSSSMEQHAAETLSSATSTTTSTSNPGGQSSGSIGPFLAVMSVLTVLAVASCVLSWMWKNRRPPTPLDRIKYRGCVGWVKGKFEFGGVAGAKIMVCEEEHHKSECKVQEGGGEVAPQNQNDPFQSV